MGSIRSTNTDNNCILTILIEKPIQLTRVNAVPFNCAGAEEATMVENCGESDTTTMPQNENTSKK